jgi:uncharacterized protein YbcI
MARRQEDRSNRELNRDISRSLAALFKDATGRGPTHARTYLQGNFVITVFQDLMTKPERSLKEEHQEDTVRDLRRLFQETLHDDAVAAVEKLTGRKVLAFLSDHAVEGDYAAEVFVLEPGLGEEEE